MDLLISISTFLKRELMIFSWYDCLEIILLATAVYYFMRWLAQDTQKNLITWFYGYCALLCASFYLGLQSLHFLMLVTSPVVLMLFILVHQQILQKNFVTLTSLSPKALPTAHWLEELIQGCLHALNKNREVFCIIERTDSLDQFLATNCIFNAEITQDLLDQLIIKTAHEGMVTLWVNHAGKLHGFNPTWRTTPDEIWITQDVKALHAWKQNALLMTEKSDALMFTISPTTRLCTIIIEGKIVNDLNAHHAFALLKNYCSLTTKPGENHGNSIDPRARFKQTTLEK